MKHRTEPLQGRKPDGSESITNELEQADPGGAEPLEDSGFEDETPDLDFEEER